MIPNNCCNEPEAGSSKNISTEAVDNLVGKIYRPQNFPLISVLPNKCLIFGHFFISLFLNDLFI
jgi:hypothetical protein